MIGRKLGHGVVAGAAGVTTLNAITYPGMAIRARPSGDSPSQASDVVPHMGFGPATYATLTALDNHAWTARRLPMATAKQTKTAYEIARQRDLPGRSKMGRDELARKLGFK